MTFCFALFSFSLSFSLSCLSLPLSCLSSSPSFSLSLSLSLSLSQYLGVDGVNVGTLVNKCLGAGPGALADGPVQQRYAVLAGGLR